MCKLYLGGECHCHVNSVSSSSLILGSCHYHPGPCMEQVTHSCIWWGYPIYLSLWEETLCHLRVFGCTAYIHIKKDKRKGLSSHTEKCVFIGYPAEYKAWMFYNPLTRNTIISTTAEFDECTFPGLSMPFPPPSPPPPTVEPSEPSFMEPEP